MRRRVRKSRARAEPCWTSAGYFYTLGFETFYKQTKTVRVRVVGGAVKVHRRPRARARARIACFIFEAAGEDFHYYSRKPAV